MKCLDSRDLREKTWQGFEMGSGAGEESVGQESSVYLRPPLRQRNPGRGGTVWGRGTPGIHFGYVASEAPLRTILEEMPCRQLCLGV